VGGKTGPNPTDRAKSGTKRSLLTDGRGVPLGVAVSGANTHDKWLVWRTLASVPILRPAEQPASEIKENLCMDKGYDYPDVREIVQWWGYTAHIRTRGEEKHPKQTIPGYRARRWVVERTHSWFNRFRRLLIRWEKKPENYLGFIHFACAWITLRASGVFG
jgi:putative transposase